MGARGGRAIPLNEVEFGPGIFGVEVAAQRFYGRSASSLTLQQAAELAATLSWPLRSNPADNPGSMRRRADMLLGRLDPVPGEPPLPPMPPGLIPPPALEETAAPPPTPVGDTLVLPDTIHPDTIPPDTLAGAPARW